MGRAARNQGEGKVPQPWKSPHRGSPATPWFLSRFPAGRGILDLPTPAESPSQEEEVTWVIEESF